MEDSVTTTAYFETQLLGSRDRLFQRIGRVQYDQGIPLAAERVSNVDTPSSHHPHRKRRLRPTLCERTSHFCDPSVICSRHSCDMAMSLAHQFVPRPMAATADLAYGVVTV
jgi:hypothetical protein